MEGSDDLLDYTSKIDALVDRIDAMLASRESGHHQTIHHTTGGLGAWGAAAVTACFFSTLMVIAFAIVVLPELHDHRAWIDIFRGKIATLETHQQKGQSP